MTNPHAPLPPTEDWVEQIRERHKAATPGPWTPDDPDDLSSDIRAAGGACIAMVYTAVDFPCLDEDECDVADIECRANLEFIAHARTDIPRLLAALTDARKDTARLEWMQEHDAYVHVSDNEAASCSVHSNRDYQIFGSASGYDIRTAIDDAMAKDAAHV